MINFIKLTSLEDVAEILWSDGPECLLIAGGTDLLVRERPFAGRRILVDIGRVEELRRVFVDQEEDLWVGAGLTHQEIADHPLIRRRAHLLQLACGAVGSPQIRNRGTLGGNLANASPAGDSIPALACLDARVEVAGRERRREIDLLSFFLGPGRVGLEVDELVVAVRIPRRRGRTVAFFRKAGQRRGACCSKASVAFLAHRHAGGRLSEVRVSLGAVGPEVIRAGEAERALEGQVLGPAVIAAAAESAAVAARPIDDIRSTAEYRRKAVGALLTEGLLQIHDHQRRLKGKRRRRRR